MGGQQYFYSNEKDEVELNRLRLVEETYDPITIRHIETIHASEGWNCLEIGAGSGSIAQYLARYVGPSGKVVATDIDLRFLSNINVPNLKIRRQDVLKDDLEINQYDLVHCRLLLRHLSEPEKGLNRMAAALRPGGWLLIEETDYGSVLSTDITNPLAATFISSFRIGLDFLRNKGIFDPYFGRRVRRLVEDLGFADVMQEGWTCVMRGGEPFTFLHAMIINATSKPMISAGIITHEQFESFKRFFADPTFEFLGPTMFSAWGRRPT